ncbi:MAG: hypothetical protein JWO46_27 [Nocardioidaceae bacterium]|nr:hypothetical protein [Nocardioidaceae bacterium]
MTVSLSPRRRSLARRSAVAVGALALGSLAVAAPASAYPNEGCSAVINGVVAVNSTVTATVTYTAPHVGTTAYEWDLISDPDGDGLQDYETVSGLSTYTLKESDAGKQLVLFTSDTNNSCNTKVSPIIGRLSTPVSSAPTASGTWKKGKTLTANVGTVPAGTSVTYQWVRQLKVKGKHRIVIKPIHGATAATYKLKQKDKGKKVGAQVTYSKATYNPTVLYTQAKKVH